MSKSEGLPLLCLLVGVFLSDIALAHANEKKAGDWLIRGRYIGVIPDETTRVDVIGGSAEAQNAYVPEVDFTYFLTDHVAVELIATTSPHDMALKGSTAGDVDLGDVWILPPTVTLQYHFDPFSDMMISPYVGAGLGYIFYYSEDAAAGSAATNIEYEDAISYALQAGGGYSHC